MILKNLSKKTIITTDLKEVTSLEDRVFGLLKRSNPRSLLFKTRFGLHTFGLKEPIDVLVLNDNLKVVKIRQNLKPNQLFFWHPLFATVVELPADSIANTETEIGDQLSVDP